MEEEIINETEEVFAPNESDFAKELMQKMGYNGQPQKGLNKINQDVETLLDWDDPETTSDVISLYIPPSEEAKVAGQVIFLNKMENPNSPWKVGIYFRRPDLFEGQLCRANTSAGITFLQHFALDLLRKGGEVDTSKKLDDLLLNFPE